MGRFHDAINAQIANEFGAAQQYLAVAVFYDKETLPQLAGHFYRQALEERNHALMLVQYLLDADEPVTIPAVTAPRTGFANAADPVRLALEQEKNVTQQIVDLVRIARDEGDIVGEQFLHWFLEEQREEVSSMSSLLTIVERAADSNLLLVEQHLSQVQPGSAGQDPSAPPAAGGAL